MELRMGTIKSYDAGNHTAGVQVDISPVYLAGVPISRGIAGAEVVAERVCVIVLADASDNEDAMIVGVY